MMLRVTSRGILRRCVVFRVPLVRFYATDGSLNSFIPKSMPLGVDKTIETNIKSETNKLSKTLEKFWEKVDTCYNNQTNEYEVQLDGKTIKTPHGFPISIPKSKKQLAYLIKHEWANLPDLKIKTHSLPLTSITSRAIDLINCQKQSINNPELIAKVGKLDDIKYNLLRYFDTDTCLIFATDKEYEGKLRKRQHELYLPLIKEYEDFFTQYGHQNGLLPSDDYKMTIESLDCQTNGLRGNEQSLTTQNIVLHWLNQLPIYDLIALEKAVLTSKSFLCGISLLRSNVSDEKNMAEIYQINKSNIDDYFHKTIEEIVELGNLETIYQTNEWGEVEDTHDVDKVDWLRNLTSAAILCH